MAKTYKENIAIICTQLGVPLPEHLTMDQNQIEDLILAVKTRLATYDPLPTGNAVVADVLATKTFSNAEALGLTGTMVNRGAVTLEIDDVADELAIAIGYHDGTGKAKIAAAEVAKLITDNIKAGVTILGVAGKASVVDTASGDATAADIVAGKKAWVNGVEIVGEHV